MVQNLHPVILGPKTTALTFEDKEKLCKKPSQAKVLRYGRVDGPRSDCHRRRHPGLQSRVMSPADGMSKQRLAGADLAPVASPRKRDDF